MASPIVRKAPRPFGVSRSSVLLVDPAAEEEQLATARLTVVTDEEGRLCTVHKPGQEIAASVS